MTPAMLIDSALKATGGKTDNKDALRAALMKADFKSLRGDFKFNTNHYPIQDFYLVKVAKRADGKYQTEIAQKVFDELRRSARQGLRDEVRPSLAAPRPACGPAGRPRRWLSRCAGMPWHAVDSHLAAPLRSGRRARPHAGRG